MIRFRSFFFCTLITLSVLIGISNAADSSVLRIGSLLPLTGPAAPMGEEMQKGQLLAKEFWNSNRDKYKTPQIELTIEDSKSSPKDAVTGYMKLRSQNISIITANLSSICLALIPKVKAEDVLFFADAAHPAITQQPNPKIYRNSSTSELEAIEIAKTIKGKGVKKLSVLYVNDEYGVAFNKELHSQLANVMIDDVAFDAKAAEFRVLAMKAIQSKPDGIIIVGIGKSIGTLILALREQRFAGDIYANIGYLLTGGREAAGSAGKGIYYTRMKVPVSVAGKWAESEYKKRFGNQMTSEAMLEFNTISLIVVASKGTQFNPMEISKKMQSAVVELFGTNRLTAKGDILPDMGVLVDTGN